MTTSLDELFDAPPELPMDDGPDEPTAHACDGCGDLHHNANLVEHAAHGGFLCPSCRKYDALDLRCTYCLEIEKHDERTVRTADTFAGFPVESFWLHISCLEKAERPY